MLYRIERGHPKKGPFGTPRNPGTPTIDEFNLRIGQVRAGDLSRTITHKHPINEPQAAPLRSLSNEELLRFQVEDPISATIKQTSGRLSLTNGNHRSAEIINRVNLSEIPPDTIIRILVHD